MTQIKTLIFPSLISTFYSESVEEMKKIEKKVNDTLADIQKNGGHVIDIDIDKKDSTILMYTITYDDNKKQPIETEPLVVKNVNIRDNVNEYPDLVATLSNGKTMVLGRVYERKITEHMIDNFIGLTIEDALELLRDISEEN